MTLAIAAAFKAAASSFTIAPVRVELDAAHRTGVLTVHNQGDAPILVQLRAVAWSQSDGVDRYDDTRELLTTPPVFELPAQGDQIVRVALRREPDEARELNYRLFLEEVPRAQASTGSGLNIALRLSVPVFIAPARAAQPQVAWQAEELPDGSVKLQASNQGLAHLQITDFELRFGDSSAAVRVGPAKYALPGAQVAWVVTPPAGVSRDAALQIHGFSDRGEFTAQAARSAP